MKKFYFKGDHSIETFDERVKFVEESGALEFLANNPHSSIANGMSEAISTYLFRSSDIQSTRHLEYSFYRDRSKYMDSASYSRVNTTFHGDGTGVADNTGTFALYDFLNNQAEDVDYHLTDEDIQRIFSKDNLGISEIRNTLMVSDFIRENAHTLNKELVNQVMFIVDSVYSACRNSDDMLVVNLTCKGLNATEIAKKINVSKQAVDQRLRRIIERVSW